MSFFFSQIVYGFTLNTEKLASAVFDACVIIVMSTKLIANVLHKQKAISRGDTST